jgi:hypothetical protein
MNEIINSIEQQKAIIKEFFDEKAIEHVIEAAHFISIPHKANSEKFYDEYVLNDSDFPLEDNKFYQSITELSARLNNLISRIKEYKDIDLEIQDLSLDIQLIDEDIADIDSNSVDDTRKKINRKKLLLQKERKQNEISLKEYSIGFIKSDLQEVYHEFLAWKALAEKYSKQCKLESYGISREAGMEIKKEFLRMSVDPKEAKGGEVPIVLDWKKINKAIIERSEQEILLPFKEKSNLIDDSRR